MEHDSFSTITPEILHLAGMSKTAGIIEQELFSKYDVKRGLRDINGNGVLAGLTNISNIQLSASPQIRIQLFPGNPVPMGEAIHHDL